MTFLNLGWKFKHSNKTKSIGLKKEINGHKYHLKRKIKFKSKFNLIIWTEWLCKNVIYNVVKIILRSLLSNVFRYAKIIKKLSSIKKPQKCSIHSTKTSYKLVSKELYLQNIMDKQNLLILKNIKKPYQHLNLKIILIQLTYLINW